MSRTKSQQSRCSACCMRFELCICEAIARCRLSLAHISTHIFILMHHRELRLTTNTGRLATLTIPHCETRLRGQPGCDLDSSGILVPHRQALFLYPSADAQILTPELLRTFSQPITLIVPDGSWRQTSKVAKREAFLKDVPRIKLAPGLLSKYELRREHNVEGLATFEAIARSLGILENGQVQSDLEVVFQQMVDRTLFSRGRLPSGNTRN